MITGVHSIIYSTDPEADRAFLRDVLELTNVDVGDGWLIFGLPPSEIAVHPSEKNDVQELYLMCVRALGTEPSPGAARPGDLRPARQSAGRIWRHDRRLDRVLAN